MLGAIPVKRPQDYAVKGSGVIFTENSSEIQGIGTIFTKEVSPGDTLKGPNFEFLVKSVENDTRLTGSSSTVFEKSAYKIIPKLDQSHVYEAVQQELKKGRCIGIFPEGGSHDRTTPLPLKAGVCLMALGAMARYNITVTIQCIGLNYYEGHKFRSKAIINFGIPYSIPRELATLFLQNRKKAIEILLKPIETVRTTQRLKEVWVTAPSYEELSHVFMARRVYKPEKVRDNPALIMEMNIKFAKGYRFIKEKYPDCQELKDAIKIVEDYTKGLKLFGLHDYQVRLSNFSKSRLIIYTIFTFVRIIISLTLVRNK